MGGGGEVGAGGTISSADLPPEKKISEDSHHAWIGKSHRCLYGLGKPPETFRNHPETSFWNPLETFGNFWKPSGNFRKPSGNLPVSVHAELGKPAGNRPLPSLCAIFMQYTRGSAG